MYRPKLYKLTVEPGLQKPTFKKVFRFLGFLGLFRFLRVFQYKRRTQKYEPKYMKTPHTYLTKNKSPVSEGLRLSLIHI